MANFYNTVLEKLSSGIDGLLRYAQEINNNSEKILSDSDIASTSSTDILLNLFNCLYSGL